MLRIALPGVFLLPLAEVTRGVNERVERRRRYLQPVAGLDFLEVLCHDLLQFR